MTLIGLWLQTPPPIDDGTIGQVVDGINQFGSVSGDTQLAAIISLIIGFLIVIVVYEVRQFNRGQQMSSIYMSEIKDLNEKLDSKDEQIKADQALFADSRRECNADIDNLRDEKRLLEDAISEANREIADLNHTIVIQEQTIQDCEETGGK